MSSSSLEAGEYNLVEMWLRKDPTRWIAGAIAGLFAGAVMAAAAMLLASALGYEAWFPIKVAALPIFGNSATEVGFQVKYIATGLIAHETLCLFLGIVYAHFTGTNFLPALLGVGLVWGVFSWIFINNLFTQSFKPVFAAHLSPAVGFFLCLIFGLSLPSVAFFDRALRGGREY